MEESWPGVPKHECLTYSKIMLHSHFEVIDKAIYEEKAPEIL